MHLRSTHRGLHRPRKGRKPRISHVHPPTNIERQFTSAITHLVAPMRTAVRLMVLPNLRLIQGPHKDHADADFWAQIKQVVNGGVEYADKRTPDSDTTRVASNAAVATAVQQGEGWRKQAREQIGVDPFRHEPWLSPMLQATTKNSVALIKSIPSRYFTDLEHVIQTNVAAGMRHEDLAKLIQSDFVDPDGKASVKASRQAALIARDQTNKLFGNLAKLRQTNLGIVSYVWRTARDERVRPEHRERDGQQFDWDDPPEDGAPGQPINCRCIAEPVFPEESDDGGDTGDDGSDVDPFNEGEATEEATTPAEVADPEQTDLEPAPDVETPRSTHTIRNQKTALVQVIMGD